MLHDSAKARPRILQAGPEAGPGTGTWSTKSNHLATPIQMDGNRAPLLQIRQWPPDKVSGKNDNGFSGGFVSLVTVQGYFDGVWLTMRRN